MTTYATGGLPQGFKVSGIAAGIKSSGSKDMALFYSTTPAVIAGVFTTNQVKAASVKLCMKKLKKHKAQAIVVNSGNANACTGTEGVKHAEEMVALTANGLKIGKSNVFVCSTGSIGIPLPMLKIKKGIPHLIDALSSKHIQVAAEAIMTTDTRPKKTSATITIDGIPVTVSAVAKGAGMIEPNMATMLAFFMTDAAVDAIALQQCLKKAVAQSFNRISVDGDQSTNDTVLFMANGQAENKTLKPSHKNWPDFCALVNKLALGLALQIVKDGEGATKCITVKVSGARNQREADAAARSVANSMLVKTGWAGNGTIWGRIMDALGYSAARIKEDKVAISYDGVQIVKNGISTGTKGTTRIMKKKDITLEVDLNVGKGNATVYTCNCTEEYVRINM